MTGPQKHTIKNTFHLRRYDWKTREKNSPQKSYLPEFLFPLKFNSEFTPEKWRLEDYILSYWDIGNFSGANC